MFHHLPFSLLIIPLVLNVSCCRRSSRLNGSSCGPGNTLIAAILCNTGKNTAYSNAVFIFTMSHHILRKGSCPDRQP